MLVKISASWLPLVENQIHHKCPPNVIYFQKLAQSKLQFQFFTIFTPQMQQKPANVIQLWQAACFFF